MAQALTVNQLLEECKRVKKAGHGNKKVIISGDDEGNSFHELFYGINTKAEDFDMNCMPYGVDSKNINEYVILG